MSSQKKKKESNLQSLLLIMCGKMYPLIYKGNLLFKNVDVVVTFF